MNKQKTPEIYSLTVLEMTSPNTSPPLPFPASGGPRHALAVAASFRSLLLSSHSCMCMSSNTCHWIFKPGWTTCSQALSQDNPCSILCLSLLLCPGTDDPGWDNTPNPRAQLSRMASSCHLHFLFIQSGLASSLCCLRRDQSFPVWPP